MLVINLAYTQVFIDYIWDHKLLAVTTGYKAQGLERFSGFWSHPFVFMRFAMVRQSLPDALTTVLCHLQIWFNLASQSLLVRGRTGH